MFSFMAPGPCLHNSSCTDQFRQEYVKSARHAAKETGVVKSMAASISSHRCSMHHHQGRDIAGLFGSNSYGDTRSGRAHRKRSNFCRAFLDKIACTLCFRLYLYPWRQLQGQRECVQPFLEQARYQWWYWERLRFPSSGSGAGLCLVSQEEPLGFRQNG
ncbi:hypothetical protein BDP27DRAFT_1054742 [Rhodocollybia butyracea]|uniref:Uncharacterized protein n=1 Tax=Rhodocollybia butyracea TaxID=206335 RepID=A0A9P5PI21_9AGAR|nr:hypothetical protein BDP27DRAFT_1054742 [Rhodocollybia butyracea]